MSGLLFCPCFCNTTVLLYLDGLDEVVGFFSFSFCSIFLKYRKNRFFFFLLLAALVFSLFDDCKAFYLTWILVCGFYQMRKMMRFSSKYISVKYLEGWYLFFFNGGVWRTP